jgi:hypothetical protein
VAQDKAAQTAQSFWVLISTRLFQAYASQAHGATFCSPDRKTSIQVFVIRFIDDSNSCVNDFTAKHTSVPSLLEKATHDAQLWNSLLYRTGALESSQCVFHISDFAFSTSGSPVLQDQVSSPLVILVKDEQGTAHAFKYLSSRKPWKSLGCYKSPFGSVKMTMEALVQKHGATLNWSLVDIWIESLLIGTSYPS